jgi:hypothetical protein
VITAPFWLELEDCPEVELDVVEPDADEVGDEVELVEYVAEELTDEADVELAMDDDDSVWDPLDDVTEVTVFELDEELEAGDVEELADCNATEAPSTASVRTTAAATIA